MKNNTQFKYLTLLLLFISYSGYGQTIEETFKSILDSTYQANQDAVAIMIHVEAPDKNISWTSAIGFSNKETEQAIDKNQPVLIASNTKTYVSATILKLVEQGKFNLDDPIKKLICRKTKRLMKKTGYDLNKITVRNLLSHTSGITDHVDDGYFKFVNENPKYQWSRNEQIKRAMKLAVPSEAGKAYAYADINYLLLSEIMERKTGESFYTTIRELLEFDKHDLNATWFIDLEQYPKNVLPLANQYSDKFVVNSSDINPSWDLYGGGGLAANSKDLALFFQLLFNGKIIKDENVLSEMSRYVIPREKSRNYCLGLFNIPTFFGKTVYYHGGFWGTDVMYVPESNASISIFTQNRENRGLNPELANKIITALNQ